jgi:predicted anti-sigma-YlaC factor YlaD
MTSIRQLRECHRTAKKLQFFLDRDPSAPLSDEDRRRVQAHLAECEKCSTLSSEYQALHASLQQLGSSMTPEPQVVDRVKVALNRALEAEGN